VQHALGCREAIDLDAKGAGWSLGCTRGVVRAGESEKEREEESGTANVTTSVKR